MSDHKSQGAPNSKATWPLSLVSGLLLWLAYFPVDWGGLAWVALVPWLVMLRCGNGRIYWASFAAGGLFGLLALQWMRLADPLMYWAWLSLALVLALHWWLFTVLTVRLVKGGWPMPLVAPLVWVSLEWARANVDIGFSWYFLAHTQHAQLPHLGLVPITGAYGISALVMLVNTTLADLLAQFSSREVKRRAWCKRATVGPTRDSSLTSAHKEDLSDKAGVSSKQSRWRFVGGLGWAMACLALIAVNPILAWHWQAVYVRQGSVRVVIVQPNEPQDVRNAPSEERQRRSWAEFRELVRQIREVQQTNGPAALVIWPETSMPFDWVRVLDNTEGGLSGSLRPDDAAAELPAVPKAVVNSADNRRLDTHSTGAVANGDSMLSDARKLQSLGESILSELAQLASTSMLVGVNTRLYWVHQENANASAGNKGPVITVIRYNSALLVNAAGKVVGRYDKTYRIPFGEYLPLRDVFPWVSWLSPYEYEYSIVAGENVQPLALGETGSHFGVLICYEDTVPHLPRQFFGGPASPDFFVNISNDGWFKGAEEHEQHLAIARFRSAETRRAMARSVNMGISAVIDGDGTILALPSPSWRDSKARAAVFMAEIPLYQGETVYVRYGDWFAWTNVGLTAMLLLTLVLRALRRQSIAAGSG